jgi:hypothetical protein
MTNAPTERNAAMANEPARFNAGYVPSDEELRRDALAAANTAVAGGDKSAVLPLAREFYAFLKGGAEPKCE